jgi:drug/metabolite transporter (DMT)-like permease
VIDAGPPASPAHDRNDVARATGLVVLAACCFGSIPILVSLGATLGVTLLTLLVWRYVLGGALLVLAAGGPGALRLPRALAMRALVIGGAGQAFVALVSLSALRYIPAATLSFLFYTYPAWIAVIAALRRVEPLTRRRIVALLLSFAGITTMIGMPGTQSLHPAGIALALGSALFYALYVPAIGVLQQAIAPRVVAAYMSIGALLVLVLASPVLGGFAVRLPPQAWGVVAALGLVSTLLGFLAFLRGLAVIGPVRTAIVATVEPFWTAVLAALVLEQPLTVPTLTGGALIAAAVIVIQFTRPAPAAVE